MHHCFFSYHRVSSRYRLWVSGGPGRQVDYEQAMCPCSKGQQAAPGRVLPADQGALLSPSKAHLTSASSAGISSTNQTWTHWSESSTGPRKWLRVWGIFCIRRDWESCNCSDIGIGHPERLELPSSSMLKPIWA